MLAGNVSEKRLITAIHCAPIEDIPLFLTPEDVEKLIDENTRAVYCESVGNPAGNVADIEGLAKVAYKHGVPALASAGPTRCGRES
jgi:selenocysteine lyase/cysteine desulfurase